MGASQGTVIPTSTPVQNVARLVYITPFPQHFYAGRFPGDPVGAYYAPTAADGKTRRCVDIAQKYRFYKYASL